MTGRDFVAALEAHGFVVRRRSTSFVWLGRADQILMVDLESRIPEAFLERLLGKGTAHEQPSGPRRSRPSALGHHHPRSIPKA